MEHSLFRPIFSLFGAYNALFCCLGNCLEKTREFSSLEYWNQQSWGEFVKIPCLFPVKQGLHPETDSQQTASTATKSLSLDIR